MEASLPPLTFFTEPYHVAMAYVVSLVALGTPLEAFERLGEAAIDQFQLVER